MTDDTRHDRTESESTDDGTATATHDGTATATDDGTATATHDRTATATDGGPEADSANQPYGLLVLEPGSAVLGRLVAGRAETVATVAERITGSARAGGDDPDHFQRERERQLRAFFEAVAAAANDAFLDGDPERAGGDPTVVGLVVGGPSDTVAAFRDGDHLDERLADRIVGTYTVEHAGEPGLRELVDAAGDTVLDAETRRTRAALDEFFDRLRDGDRVVYGDDDLDRAIDRGRVDTALVAAAVDRDRREAIERAVAAQGGETLVVPGDTDRGERFAGTFRVGGLLRPTSA